MRAGVVVAAVALVGLAAGAGVVAMSSSSDAPSIDASTWVATDVPVDLGDYAGAVDACFQRPSPGEQSGCIIELTRSATKAGKFGSALAILRSGVTRSEDMVGRCHNETHEVGKSLAAAGMPLTELYKIPFPDCRFGFYHGGMTQVSEDLDTQQLIQQLPTLCSAFGPADRSATQECVHATGHLLTDRMGTNLHGALSACSAFSEPTLQGRCSDGVLMQAIDLARPGVKDPNDPAAERIAQTWGSTRPEQEKSALGVCADLPNNDMTYVCFTNVSQTLAVLWQEDYAEVARVCESAPQEWRRACFEGIAASAFTLRSWDPRGIADACHASRSDYTKFCMASMAHSFGLQDVAERASLVCDLARRYEHQECLRGLADGTAIREQLVADTTAPGAG